MEDILLQALRSLDPTNILLIGVVVFLWRALQQEREARVLMTEKVIELGFTVKASLDKLTEALQRSR